jgi:hypothetical protein
MNPYVFYDISIISFQNEKSFRQKSSRKSKLTLYVQTIHFDNGIVYELMWNKTQNAYLLVHCTQWLRERVAILHYMHIALLLF